MLLEGILRLSELEVEEIDGIRWDCANRNGKIGGLWAGGGDGGGNGGVS